MSFREYLGIGGEDQPERICDWCGKEGVSVWWSGTKGKYCSFRCSAAGSYPRSIVIAVCVVALESILVLIQVMMFLRYPILTPAYVIIVVPQVFVTLLVLSFVYMAYIGYSMRKDRTEEYTKDGGPDAMYPS